MQNWCKSGVNIFFSFWFMGKKLNLDDFFSTSRTQSWTKLVEKKSENPLSKMPYFLNLKGYEIHLFGLASLKPSANRYTSPAPTLQCWGLVGDEEHNFIFQHCYGGVGGDFTVRCYFFPTILSKIVSRPGKRWIFQMVFGVLFLNASMNFRENFRNSSNW